MTKKVIDAQRLDQFVAQQFELSRAQAVKKIEVGLVRCNGVVIRKAAKKLRVGDVIVIEQPSPSHTHDEQPATNNPVIPILYEDLSCFVVAKPSGMTVHATPTEKTDEPTVLEVLQTSHSLPSLALAHRLDKGTSGCLLLGKNPEALEKLQQQFKDRSVTKEYLAIVIGIPKEHEATVDAAIGRSLMDRTRMSLFRTGQSRSARTHYRTLSSGSDASLLLCTITTGRTHQIRVHLRAIGHPILGDEKYGTDQSQTRSKDAGILSPCLHAWKLTFTSPATKKEVHVVAPIPEKFRRIIVQFDLALLAE